MSLSIDFAFFLLALQHTLDTCLIWHCQRPHIIFVGHWDLFFLVQCFFFFFFALYLRFYLIDKRHTSCTSSVSHCESPHIFLLVTVTYISWSSRFCLVFRPYQIGRHHILDICLACYCQWSYFCRSLWPTGSSDFALCLWPYQIRRHDILDTCSVWHWQ